MVCVVNEPQDPRTTRQDWLKEGLRVLREAGDRGLTIEAMCTRMGKTKGSFYHHFGSRKDFVRRLLEHWEEAFTAGVIQAVEPLESPVERLRALEARVVRDVDLRLERTIRLWAEREPAARAVLERVDRAREEYLYEQFEAAFGDSKRARLAARAHLALLVGTQMLYQELSREELAELNALAERLGYLPQEIRKEPP
jgi:AcrR family transcriptional regulator